MADFDLSMAITADGSDAASEVDKVTGSIDRMSAAEVRAAGGVEGLAKAHQAQVAQANAHAEAIDRVTRATSPLASSQARLDAELRRVQSAFIAGKVGLDTYTKAQQIAAGAATNFAQAQTRAAASNAQQRASLTNLNYQLQDIAMGLTMGIDPLRVLAQQGGQTAMAMQGMGGVMGTIGRFMAGPWGTAIIAVTTLLGGLFLSMRHGTKDTEDLDNITTVFKMDVDQLTDAINKNLEALEKKNRTEQDSQRITQELAQAHRERALQLRQETVALLENAKAELAAADAEMARASGGGKGAVEAASGQQSAAAARLAALEKQLADANAALFNAEREITQANIPGLQGRASTDPRSKVEVEYQTKLGALNRRLDLQINSGVARDKAEAEYTSKLQALNTERDRQLANIREENKKPPSLGEQVSASIGANILAAAQSHVGQREGQTTLQQFLKTQNIDPEKQAWCAAFINAVLASQGIQGTGSLSARSFLNYGTATNTPQAGDIVVLKSGAAPSGTHVGFYAGQSGGRVQVTGGNQSGGKVSTESFGLSSVLGFRRAPSAADQFKDEADAMEKERQALQQLTEWGSRADETIHNLGQRFTTSTGRVAQANEALHDLDRVMAEVEKKKPPNLAQLRADAQAARQEIENGINKPFRDWVSDQKTAIGQQALINAGLSDEAEVQKTVADLERQIGRELLPEQIAAVRALIQARQQEQHEAELARQAQQKYIDAVSATRDAIRGIFDFSGQGLRDLPKKLGSMIEKLVGDFLFDKIFGGLFNKLDDQAKGIMRPVKVSADELSRIIDEANRAIASLANAAAGAAGQIDPLAPLPDGANPDGSGQGQQPGDIVVTGSLETSLNKQVFRDPAEFFSSVLQQLAKGILGTKAAKTIGDLIGQAIQGAAIGRMVGGMLFGSNASSGTKTGSAIGGAIGSIAGKAIGDMAGKAIGGALGSAMGPLGSMLGSAVGGALGGLVGGLFGGKQYGKTSVGVNAMTGQFEVGGVSGSGGKQQGQAQGVADAIAQGLNQIASQLGGGINPNAANISVYKGKNYNINGQGGIHLEADAIAIGIRDALTAGAITGLSDAVKRALVQNKDINTALSEALKVKQLETLLGGLGDQLYQQFLDVERQAQERVRLAKAYGLDLVKVEELNAKQRADALDAVIKERTQGLKDFLTDMFSGDLFEGTPAEKIAAIRGQISTTRAQALQGVEGAGDQLANLERQLVEQTKAAYGTAGPEYASARSQAIADAEKVIAEETKRAQEAQERAIASLAAAQQTVDLQQETNDWLSRIYGALNGGAGASSGSSSPGTSGSYGGVSTARSGGISGTAGALA